MLWVLSFVQAERLTKLNQIAIQQMKILVQDTAPKLDAL
jgi:hypothetical protein